MHLDRKFDTVGEGHAADRNVAHRFHRRVYLLPGHRREAEPGRHFLAPRFAGGAHRQWLGRLVVAADIASSPVLTVDPEDDLHTALRRFTEKNIDYIPIVDPERRSHVLGMLSRHDVIAAYHDKVTELQRIDEQVMERPI